MDFLDEILPKVEENKKESSLPIPSYVINLARRKDRWETISSQLAKHKIAASRIVAMDGTRLRGTPYEKGKLTLGELGCLISHVEGWKCTTTTTLIMEDDIYLHPDFPAEVKILLNEVPKDFDLLLLGRNLFSEKEVERATTGKSISMHILEPEWIGYGAHCYLVSPKGAEKLLEMYPDFQRQTDVLFSDKGLKVYVSKVLLAIPINVADSDTINAKKSP